MATGISRLHRRFKVGQPRGAVAAGPLANSDCAINLRRHRFGKLGDAVVDVLHHSVGQAGRRVQKIRRRVLRLGRGRTSERVDAGERRQQFVGKDWVADQSGRWGKVKNCRHHERRGVNRCGINGPRHRLRATRAHERLERGRHFWRRIGRGVGRHILSIALGWVAGWHGDRRRLLCGRDWQRNFSRVHARNQNFARIHRRAENRIDRLSHLRRPVSLSLLAPGHAQRPAPLAARAGPGDTQPSLRRR